MSKAKLDFNTPIRNLQGEPLKEMDERTRSLSSKEVTMRSYISNLLWSTKEHDEADINTAMLAMKIYRSKDAIALKDTETVLIRKLVKKAAPNGVCYQIDSFLNGEDIYAE